MAPGRLGAVYLSAFATRLWSPWRQEACPLHHCTLRVGTSGFSVKHLWPTASMREGLPLLRRGRCCLQILISHHRFTVNPESLCFPPLVVNYLEKRVWESHSDIRGVGKPGLMCWGAGECLPWMVNWVLTLFSCHLPHLFSCLLLLPSSHSVHGAGEKPQWSWHPPQA